MDIFAKSSEWHMGYSDYYNNRPCLYVREIQVKAWQQGYEYAADEDYQSRINDNHPEL